MSKLTLNCLALMTAILTVEIAGAFTLNSSTNPNMKGWANPKVELYVNTANCPAGIDVPKIIEEAAAVWNNVATSAVRVSYGGSTTSTASSNPTTVYCAVAFNAATGADENSVPGAAAASTATGSITAGLLILNASAGNSNIANYDPKLLKIILAHEIGHILGLGHSESANALMYYSGSYKESLRLSQDDIDGITYLYPRDELGEDQIMGCGRLAGVPPSAPPVINIAVILIPLLALLALRHRTRKRQTLFVI